MLQGEAKKGQGQLKKVATEPKISILPLFGWRCLWLEVGEQSAARRGKRTELWFEVYLWLKEGPSAARRSKEGPGQLEEGRHWALS